MVESRVATLQGDNIGKLTRVTVVSLLFILLTYDQTTADISRYTYL